MLESLLADRDVITRGLIWLWTFYWRLFKTWHFLIKVPVSPPYFFVSLFLSHKGHFQSARKPENMGTCPIKYRSNRPTLENPPEPSSQGRFNPRDIITQKMKNEKNANKSNWVYYVNLPLFLCSPSGKHDRIPPQLPVLWSLWIDHVHWGKAHHHYRVCDEAPRV